jgi:hypothetical protein
MSIPTQHDPVLGPSSGVTYSTLHMVKSVKFVRSHKISNKMRALVTINIVTFFGNHSNNVAWFHTLIPIYSFTHTQTHTHTRAQTHTHTHKHTHTGCFKSTFTNLRVAVAEVTPDMLLHTCVKLTKGAILVVLHLEVTSDCNSNTSDKT